jgi:hypothetical protein
MTHELTHVLQMATTGFCYDLSWRLFMVLIDALQEEPGLLELWSIREKYSPRVRAVLDDLDREGPKGLSAREIIEGAAFFAQKVTHLPNRGPKRYAQIVVDEAPSDRYSVAYRLADARLGHDAPTFFPHVANLALCTKRPEQVFDRLLLKWRAASRTDIERSHREGVALLKRDFSEITLGTPADQIAAGKVQPILSRMVELLSELILKGAVSELALLSGEPLTRPAIDALMGPVLFKPARYGEEISCLLPRHWISTVVPSARFLEPVWLTFFAAGSYILYPQTLSE